MPVFGYAKREVNVKIVYYGPGLSGKTTNIQYIHDHIKPEFKGKLVSLATQTDRTLFFDFLPLEIGSLKGYKVRIHLYTVPGQVHYNATRKLVLKGVDGVVFVADSQRTMKDANLESYLNLEKNLQSYGKSLQSLPHVIQLNKRDLQDIARAEEMSLLLNRFKATVWEASATTGRGVLDTLMDIVKRVMHSLRGQFLELEKAEAEERAASAQAARDEEAPSESPGVGEGPAPLYPESSHGGAPEAAEPPYVPDVEDAPSPVTAPEESEPWIEELPEEAAPAPDEGPAEARQAESAACEPEAGLTGPEAFPEPKRPEPAAVPAGGAAVARFLIPLPGGSCAEVTIEVRSPYPSAVGSGEVLPQPSVVVSVRGPEEEKEPVKATIEGSAGRAEEAPGPEAVATVNAAVAGTSEGESEAAVSADEVNKVSTDEPYGAPLTADAKGPAFLSVDEEVSEIDIIGEQPSGYVPPEPSGEEAESAAPDLFAPEEPPAPEQEKAKGIMGFFRKRKH